MTVPQIVSLLYRLDVTRSRDDDCWEDCEDLLRVYGNGSYGVLRWIKRTRCVELMQDNPKYQYRARQTTYGSKRVWVIECAERKDGAQWRLSERYRVEERRVHE